MPHPELEKPAAESAPETEAALKKTATKTADKKTESPKKSSRRRVRTAVITTFSALVLGGGAMAAVLAAHEFDSPATPDLNQVAPNYHDFAASLPWPSDGETALWAQNIGSLGSSGDQTPVPIASVAKVMTAYVVLKDHPLSDGQAGPDIVVDQQAADESSLRDESSAPVRAGQHLSERTLLELMLVPSANNVARLLGRWDAGTQDAFVAEMNATAVSLGMKNTTYTDPSGLDSSTRSTAVDQMQLAKAALTDPVLLALTAEPATQVPDDPASLLTNTDALLGSDGVVGGKTGSSTPAGGALMWAAHRTLDGEDHLVLGVVLHQGSGTTPELGLAAALLAGRRLVEAMD